MRNEHALTLVTVVVAMIGLAAAAEKQPPLGKIVLLTAGGKTVAQLRIRPSGSLTLQSGHGEYDMSTQTIAGAGGTILTLSAGTNSISVRADEIKSVPDSIDLSSGTLFLLKSQGETIAELDVMKGMLVRTKGRTQVQTWQAPGAENMLKIKGAATFFSGTNSIDVDAEEIEKVPQPK